jgi:hypothetical protein
VPKDDEEAKKLLDKAEKKPAEDNTDVMDDYDDGMDEFVEAMKGDDGQPKVKKNSDISALGD